MKKIVLDLNGIFIQVENDSPELDRELACFKQIETTRHEPKIQGWATVRLSHEELTLPDKALRVFYHDDAGQVYLIDNQLFFLKNKFKIAIDRQEKVIEATYHRDAIDLPWFFIQALRWLLITLASEQGYFFLPGHLLHVKGQMIFVSGIPECGKYLALKRFCDRGSILLSDNALIGGTSANVRAFPLGIAGARADMSPDSEIYSAPYFEAHIGNIDFNGSLSKVVFVQTWNALESTLTKVDAMHMTDCLMQLNRKYYNFFTEAQLLKLAEDYRVLFRTTEAFHFFRGSSIEAEDAEIGALVDSRCSK